MLAVAAAGAGWIGAATPSTATSAAVSGAATRPNPPSDGHPLGKGGQVAPAGVSGLQFVFQGISAGGRRDRRSAAADVAEDEQR
ncbi:MAG: hypothetical protein H7288_04575 [Kineosporiaceae bacterium]|nr:hypothetical protein [Aeromicrobium sp.]